MLETLLEILAIDVSSPEIMLDDTGDLVLDWFEPMLSVSINKDGGVAWADLESSLHGNSLNELKIILEFRK